MSHVSEQEEADFAKITDHISAARSLLETGHHSEVRALMRRQHLTLYATVFDFTSKSFIDLSGTKNSKAFDSRNHPSLTTAEKDFEMRQTFAVSKLTQQFAEILHGAKSAKPEGTDPDDPFAFFETILHQWRTYSMLYQYLLKIYAHLTRMIAAKYTSSDLKRKAVQFFAKKVFGISPNDGINGRLNKFIQLLIRLMSVQLMDLEEGVSTEFCPIHLDVSVTPSETLRKKRSRVTAMEEVTVAEANEDTKVHPMTLSEAIGLGQGLLQRFQSYSPSIANEMQRGFRDPFAQSRQQLHRQLAQVQLSESRSAREYAKRVVHWLCTEQHQLANCFPTSSEPASVSDHSGSLAQMKPMQTAEDVLAALSKQELLQSEQNETQNETQTHLNDTERLLFVPDTVPHPTDDDSVNHPWLTLDFNRILGKEHTKSIRNKSSSEQHTRSLQESRIESDHLKLRRHIMDSLTTILIDDAWDFLAKTAEDSFVSWIHESIQSNSGGSDDTNKNEDALRLFALLRRIPNGDERLCELVRHECAQRLQHDLAQRQLQLGQQQQMMKNKQLHQLLTENPAESVQLVQFLADQFTRFFHQLLPNQLLSLRSFGKALCQGFQDALSAPTTANNVTTLEATERQSDQQPTSQFPDASQSPSNDILCLSLSRHTTLHLLANCVDHLCLHASLQPSTTTTLLRHDDNLSLIYYCGFIASVLHESKHFLNQLRLLLARRALHQHYRLHMRLEYTALQLLSQLPRKTPECVSDKGAESSKTASTSKPVPIIHGNTPHYTKPSLFSTTVSSVGSPLRDIHSFKMLEGMFQDLLESPELHRYFRKQLEQNHQQTQQRADPGKSVSPTQRYRNSSGVQSQPMQQPEQPMSSKTESETPVVVTNVNDHLLDSLSNTWDALTPSIILSSTKEEAVDPSLSIQSTQIDLLVLNGSHWPELMGRGYTGEQPLSYQLQHHAKRQELFSELPEGSLEGQVTEAFGNYYSTHYSRRKISWISGAGSALVRIRPWEEMMQSRTSSRRSNCPEQEIKSQQGCLVVGTMAQATILQMCQQYHHQGKQSCQITPLTVGDLITRTHFSLKHLSSLLHSLSSRHVPAKPWAVESLLQTKDPLLKVTTSTSNHTTSLTEVNLLRDALWPLLLKEIDEVQLNDTCIFTGETAEAAAAATTEEDDTHRYWRLPAVLSFEDDNAITSPIVATAKTLTAEEVFNGDLISFALWDSSASLQLQSSQFQQATTPAEGGSTEALQNTSAVKQQHELLLSLILHEFKQQQQQTHSELYQKVVEILQAHPHWSCSETPLSELSFKEQMETLLARGYVRRQGSQGYLYQI